MTQVKSVYKIIKYQKQSTTTGAWVKAGELKNGTRAKIVSETKPSPSSFLDKNGNPKTQDVAKVRFEGQPDALNVSLNRATIGGLIDAFGDDSVNWQNKVLTVETEKVRVGGKTNIALYLIPDGYQKIDDSNGYAMIVRGEEIENQNEEIPVINDDIDKISNIPF